MSRLVSQKDIKFMARYQFLHFQFVVSDSVLKNNCYVLLSQVSGYFTSTQSRDQHKTDCFKSELNYLSRWAGVRKFMTYLMFLFTHSARLIRTLIPTCILSDKVICASSKEVKTRCLSFSPGGLCDRVRGRGHRHGGVPAANQTSSWKSHD